MIRALAAAVLLLGLAACNTIDAGTAAKPAPRPVSGKPLPFAPPPPPISEEEGVACAADIKQCPDGSSVSRNAANACAFDLCPGEPKP